MVGSFLNVVVHRLPRMLQQQWHTQCAELLGHTPPEQTTYHLAWPGSQCPHCKHPLTVLENIPLVSFALQRGRCRACGAAISWRYPLLEGIAGLCAVVVVLHFGMTPQAGAALCLTWALLAASAIDLEHQLLPDGITLPLVWIGLFLSFFGVFVDLPHAVIGAMVGYLSLWSVYWAFRLLTGKEGMGYGDFKLLAALGAWMGWQALPMVVFLSSLVGAVVGLSLILVRGRARSQPMPFGPFLAAAGWIALLWEQDLFQGYLRWIHAL